MSPKFLSPEFALSPEFQPDPAGLDQGPNLYAYVGNDPVNAGDPRGTCNPHGGCGEWGGEPEGSSSDGDLIAPAIDPGSPPAESLQGAASSPSGEATAVAQTEGATQEQTNGQGQQTRTDSTGNQIDKDAISSYADQHAANRSLGKCAAFCRRAFEAGGVNTEGHPIDAKDWGPTLLKNGAVVVRQNSYAPQKGDVAVFAGSDTHPHGHITIYDGKQWVSDFKQKGMSQYKTPAPPVTIYRFPDK